MMAGKSARSLVQFVVLLSIGILLVWLSYRQVEPEKEHIAESFQNADYFWIAISMLIALFSHFLRAYRWNYLLMPLGYRVNLLNSFCHVLVGYFANYGIPRMGEVSRCTLAAKYDKVPFEIGFGTVITERIVDTLVFIVIFFLTLIIQFSELIGLANKLLFDPLRNRFSAMDRSQAIVIGLIFIALAVTIYLVRKKLSGLLSGRLGKVIRGIGSGIGSIRKLHHPWKFVFFSFAIWICYFYALYVCLFALPATSRLGQAECLTLLLFGTLGVIFAPGGLGAYPAIVGGILMYTYNVDAVSSFSLPWLSWTAQFILLLVTGIAALIFLPLYNRKKNVVSQPA